MRSHISTKQVALILTVITILAVTSCGPRPRGNPDFSAISSPEIPIVSGITPTPLPTSTHTPTPTETPTTTPTHTPSLFSIDQGTIPPTPTPTSTVTPTATENIEPTETPTSVPPTATSTPRPVPTTPPDPPRQGGSWDMEDGFVTWTNPYGDDCSGSKIAIGWQGFTSRGEYGSSCFVQNEYGPNVFSGGQSQQITFDFVDSHAGLFRSFDSRPGHRYQVFARLRHVNTVPPMQFHFGVDLTGGTDWMAPSVEWTPWREFRIDEWITHEQIFRATGPKTTIYVKGYHEAATQGGATFFDHIEVIDLGR